MFISESCVEVPLWMTGNNASEPWELLCPPALEAEKF